MIEIGRLVVQFQPLFGCPLIEIVDRKKDEGFIWFYFFPFNLFWYGKEGSVK